MNLHTATYRNEKWTLGAWQGGQRWGINTNGNVRVFDVRTPFTNLTEVRVVPKDAVVIELKELENVEGLIEYMRRASWVGGGDVIARRDQRKVMETIQEVVRQLTPTPAEPKVISPRVEASYPDNSHRQIWKGIISEITHKQVWERESDGQRADYSDLINPVIISEGVDK